MPLSSAQPPDIRNSAKFSVAYVLDTLASCPERQATTYIFTEFQSENELGRSVLKEHAALLGKRGRWFMLVNLDCGDLEEDGRRKGDEGWSGGGTFVDVEILRECRRGRDEIGWMRR